MRRILPIRALFVMEAEDFLDVKEIGQNRGPGVEWFQKLGQINPGDPWCAAFINGVAEVACAKKNMRSPFEQVPLQGYVQSYADHAESHGWVLGDGRPGMGDLFMIWHRGKGRYAHIGIVRQVFSNTFSTIEGNSNDEGSREGIAVVSNVRPYGDSIVFADPWRQYE